MNRTNSNWDKINLLKNSLLLGSTQLLSGFLSALFIWILNHNKLSKELSIIVVFYTINQLCLIFINWTQPLYIRDGLEFYSKNKQLNHLFFPRLFFSLFIALLILILCFYFGDYLVCFLKINRQILNYAIIYFIFQIVFWHLHNSFQSIKLIPEQSYMLILDKLTPLLLFPILFHFNLINQKYILFSIIAGNIIGIFYGFFKIKKHIITKFNIFNFKNYLFDSIPLIASVIVSFLATGSIDHFFIKHYLNESQLVNYFIIFQFYGMYLQFPTVISSLILNWLTSLIVEKKTKTIKIFFKKTTPILSILFLFVSLFVYIIIAIILKMFYQIDENLFQAPLLILIFSSVISFINIIAFSPFILAKRNIKLSLYLSITNAFLNLVGNYLLIFEFEIIGIAYSTFISVFVSINIVTIYIFIKNNIIDFQLFFLYLSLFIGASTALFFPSFSFLIITIGFLILIMLFIFKIKTIRIVFKNLKQTLIEK